MKKVYLKYLLSLFVVLTTVFSFGSTETKSLINVQSENLSVVIDFVLSDSFVGDHFSTNKKNRQHQTEHQIFENEVDDDDENESLKLKVVNNITPTFICPLEEQLGLKISSLDTREETSLCRYILYQVFRI